MATKRSVNQTADACILRLRFPSRDCSQIPFWFWNDDLEPDTMRRQMRQMAAQGVHGACPHPRFGMDRRQYLEPAFWAAMDATVEEAAALGSKILLYDEYNWPSGSAGGRVTDGRPDLYPHALDWVLREATGPGPAAFSGFQAGEVSGRVERVVAAFLVPVGSPAPQATEEYAEKDVRHWGQIDADGQAVRGELPSGLQHVLVFFQTVGSNPSPLDTGSGSFVDFLNPEVGQRFIALTHEAYRQRYGQHFGTTITGIFTDEPSTISSGPLPWTHGMAEYFRQQRGYDLLHHLPALCDDAYPNGWFHRASYWQTVAERFEETFFGPMAAWCRAAGIALTGHIFEEFVSAWPAAPHLMDWLRHFDWPGIDALGPRASAIGCKIPASVAHLEGNRPFLCEALGLAHGWNLTLDTARRGFQYVAVMGVDTVVPHAFHQSIDDPQMECPPSFFIPAPHWPLYHRLAALTDRLCAFNRCGSHVAPVAVYYPIASLWADGTGGRGQGGKPWEVRSNGNDHARVTINAFEGVLEKISAGPWDCDVVDAKALTQARMTDGQLLIGPERFSCLVLPALRTIEAAAVEPIIAFLAGGGRVVVIGGAPHRCFPDVDGHLARRLAEALAQAPGGAVEYLTSPGDLESQLERMLPQAATMRFLGPRPPDVLVIARREDDTQLWLFVNDATEARHGVIQLPAPADAAIGCMDPATGDLVSADVRRDGNAWQMDLDLPGHGSVILIAAKDISDLPARPATRTLRQRLSLDAWRLQLTGVEEELAGRRLVSCPLPAWRMRERGWEIVPGWEHPGFDDSDWQRVSAHEGRARGAVTAASVLLRSPLPPGAQALRMPLPVTGEYCLFVNGVLVERRLTPPPPRHLLDLTPWVKGVGDTLAIEVATLRGLPGLDAPVEVLCADVALPSLVPWSQLGLGWFSGRIRYRRTVTLKDRPASAWLDLGSVQHDAAVWVNGHLAAELVWSPFRADLANHLVAGDNEIVVEVGNTLANRFTWDDAYPTRTGASWGQIPRADPSGLIGPVYLELT